MHASREQIKRSKAIQRHTGRTFHLATRFLPQSVRYPTYVLYAFFRIADDVVDTTEDVDPAAQRAELEAIRAAALGEQDTDNPVLSAFADLREEHDIPREEVDVFIDAMAMDIDRSRYQTHEELARYLRGSSVAVGQMMLEVMDPPEKEQARDHAAAMGEALQLTNFLRDVREDILDYDRIYLPEEELREHGLSHADVEARRFSPGFAEAMADELRLAEEKYAYGVRGIEYLPADSQFAVLAAAVLYAEYHRLIREQDYDVLSERPRLSMTRRLSVVARTWLAWRRSRDPVAVFHQVTDLPLTTEEPPTASGGIVASATSLSSSAMQVGRSIVRGSIGRML